MADNHWKDLHKLMPCQFTDKNTCTCANSIDQSNKFKNVLQNPHIVDWYFSWRLNQFLAHFFDGCLQSEWRWHRYE